MGSKQSHHPAVPAPTRAALPGILLVMFLGALDQTVMAAALLTPTPNPHPTRSLG
jgi:hypothetical protein